MQTSTLAEVMNQKNLGNLPVLEYREENGKAVIEIQLRQAVSEPPKPRYDVEKMIAKLRAMQFSLGYATNVTQDLRRERDSSPPSPSLRRKPKKA